MMSSLQIKIILCYIGLLNFKKYLCDSIEGVNVKLDIDALKVEVPHIVVGTPGRIMDLATNRKVLDLSHVKHFVLDECDRMLVRRNGTICDIEKDHPTTVMRTYMHKAEVGMRRDVQTIFKATPHEKQVMMYSATLDKEIRPICRKFCQDVRFSERNLRCYNYLRFPLKN